MSQHGELRSCLWHPCCHRLRKTKKSGPRSFPSHTQSLVNQYTGPKMWVTGNDLWAVTKTRRLFLLLVSRLLVLVYNSQIRSCHIVTLRSPHFYIPVGLPKPTGWGDLLLRKKRYRPRIFVRKEWKGRYYLFFLEETRSCVRFCAQHRPEPMVTRPCYLSYPGFLAFHSKVKEAFRPESWIFLSLFSSSRLNFY